MTLLALSLSACTIDAAIPEDESSPDVGGAPDLAISGNTPAAPEAPEERQPEALLPDFCDDATYTDAGWKSKSTGHFSLSFPEGSPADRDSAAIATRLETAYYLIRRDLGITEEPNLTVNLSPSRVAASANGKGIRQAWPWMPRYDAIYMGAADGVERTQYGRLLTVALDYYIDSQNRYRLPMLATGLAEVMDQSNRNYHDAYAKQLLAGVESRIYMTDLEGSDLFGSNPGRAGSLVKFLIENYGTETFMDIYRASALKWNGTCNSSAYGCVETAAQATAVLDAILMDKVGEHWSDIKPLWQAEVEAALVRVSAGMGDETVAEVENLLAVMDKAINVDSSMLYRTAMEGYYCDGIKDPQRMEIAERVVHALGSSRTQLLALYDTGTLNFATANALVMRTTDDGAPQFMTLSLEHMPVGWRVVSSPDWY